MIETIKRIVAEMLDLQARSQYGTISAYNPNNYTVRAVLQPQNIETGWMPLASPWVGPSLGAVFGPPIGTDCRIDFIDGNAQASIAGGRFFNAKNPPPVVQSGQAAIVDSKGSYVRLNNDGTITLGAPTGITSTTPLLKQVGNMEIDGTLQVTQDTKLQSTVEVTGALTASATIAASGNITSSAAISDSAGSMGSMRTEYNSHEHPQSGGGNTSTPTVTM